MRERLALCFERGEGPIKLGLLAISDLISLSGPNQSLVLGWGGHRIIWNIAVKSYECGLCVK